MKEEFVIEFRVDSHEWVTYETYDTVEAAHERYEDIKDKGVVSALRICKRTVSDWETVYESDEKECD